AKVVRSIGLEAGTWLDEHGAGHRAAAGHRGAPGELGPHQEHCGELRQGGHLRPDPSGPECGPSFPVQPLLTARPLSTQQGERVSMFRGISPSCPLPGRAVEAPVSACAAKAEILPLVAHCGSDLRGGRTTRSVVGQKAAQARGPLLKTRRKGQSHPASQHHTPVGT
ncbi:hypothetical protein P7K49_010254, partial [Saguinus oedipus]